MHGCTFQILENNFFFSKKKWYYSLQCLIIKDKVMPTKHIDDLTWKKVQEEHVKAVILTKISIKDTEILKILIKKGLENITEEDYINFANNKGK